MEEKKKVRQEESKPILDAFFGWVEDTLNTKIVLNHKIKCINNLNIYKYINYLLEELPQLEDATEEEASRKYFPWFEDLPDDILNFQCDYKELTVAE